MATPKTPFRGRLGASPPAVMGVVSTDSHEDASVMPEPSPWKPPTPLLRPSAMPQDVGHEENYVSDAFIFERNQNNQDHNMEEEFLADNDISITSLQVETTSSQPPSPFSPPAESLWSETTEDQYPANHTKRQFPTLPAPMENTPQMPPPPRRRNGTPWPKQTPASSVRRNSETTTPQTAATTPHQALFLLQEEHRLWQQDYHRLNAEWQATCDSLTSQVAAQEEVLTACQTQLEESQSQCEILQQEKKNVESELQKLKVAVDDLLNDKEKQVKVLEQAQRQLEMERDQTKVKNDQYEQEIARQSKELLKVQEELNRVTDQSVRDLQTFQQEASDRSQAWNSEKQSLREEVRRLEEKLVEKNLELERRLQEERRTQAGQLHDLEGQVSTLTNALAEYRGRHDELRATVDQHIQVGKDAAAVTRRVQNVACQTEEGSLDTETLFEPITLPIGGIDSSTLPRTPTVRFGPTQSSSSPPLSHPGIPPTTPWTSDWQEARHKSRTRADPPSCLDTLPAHSFLADAMTTPLRTSHSPPALTEKEELVNFVENEHDDSGIRTSRHIPTPQTEKTTNGSNATFKSRRQNADKHEELRTLVEEKVRSVLGDQATRTYLEKTIHDLRHQLDKKESSSSTSSPTWQQETADLLAEIQRECNAAFRRGQARRKSPCNVANHPAHTRDRIHANPPAVQANDQILQDFFFNENWGTNDSTGDASIPLSLPALDESLNEIAESLNELVV